MSLDFNGTTQRVDLEGGVAINSLNAAVGAGLMLWARLDVVGQIGELLTFSQNGANANRAGLSRNAGGSFRGRAVAPDGGAIQTIVDGAPTIGTIHHVAVTWDLPTDRARIFLDGVQQIQETEAFVNAAFDATDSTQATLMSDNAADNEVEGLAMDARCYNRELSPDEIATIHVCRGHDGIWYGLRNRWRCNEREPTQTAVGVGTVKDIAEGQRNGDPAASPVYGEWTLSYRRRYP